VDSKSHIHRSIMFEGPTSSVPGRGPTHGMYIPKARLSWSSLREGNIQSPFYQHLFTSLGNELIKPLCFLCVSGHADDPISVYSICISETVGR